MGLSKNGITPQTLYKSILTKATKLPLGVHYFRLAGGSYTGEDLPEGEYNYGLAKVLKRSNTMFRVILYGGENDTIAYNQYAGGAWEGWNEFVIDVDLANYLPLSGGGRVKKDGACPLELESTSATSIWEGFYSTLGYLGRLGFSAKDTPAFMTSGGGIKELFHEGNKPTGTYTGNGSARTVNVGTGVLGSACIINDLNTGSSFAIVSSYGSIGQKYNELAKETSDDSNFASNRGIYLSASSFLNISGHTYSYTVL